MEAEQLFSAIENHPVAMVAIAIFLFISFGFKIEIKWIVKSGK